MREREGQFIAREHVVEGEAVRHDDAAVPVQDLAPLVR